MFDRDNVFIGNQWRPSAGNDWLEVVSPSTEEVVGRVPAAVPADVDLAVALARTAFDDGPWPRMPIDERAAALRAFVDAFELHQDEAVELQIDEMGGTRSFIEGVTFSIRGALDRAIKDVELVQFSEIRAGIAGDVLVVREPMGVTAGVTPWNGPLLVALTKIFPSLLMGCPIVVKLAPEAPMSAYVLAEAFRAAALPEGTLSILAGGPAVGEHLVSHRGVDLVSFTGSDVAGARIAATCGKDIRRVVLELGGKSASIVLDGDITDYLPSLVGNALRNAGQVCVSPNRVLLPEDRRDEMLEALADHVAHLRVGDPHDRDTDIGPLVSARQRDRVEGYIASGVAEGAKLVTGGDRPRGLDRGFYVEPTVFADVDPSMRIAQEEIFGPVLSVITYRDVDDAVAIANHSDFGLGGAVFSADPERAVAVARRVRTGTCAINNAPPAGGGGPFGGYKRSGIGRERSREGLESYLEVKSIALPPGYKLPERALTSRPAGTV
ncbi:MAG: aldehyde dehydrogenase [Acidimicrobiaceae bacterium]|nr:aldehyde dehydrogenase [Acidimicrobiaceae bacterium]